MVLLKLTAAARLARQVERVKGVLLVHLPDGGLDVAGTLALLAQQGVILDPADLPAVRDALVADGTIEVV